MAVDYAAVQASRPSHCARSFFWLSLSSLLVACAGNETQPASSTVPLGSGPALGSPAPSFGGASGSGGTHSGGSGGSSPVGGSGGSNQGGSASWVAPESVTLLVNGEGEPGVLWGLSDPLTVELSFAESASVEQAVVDYIEVLGDGSESLIGSSEQPPFLLPWVIDANVTPNRQYSLIARVRSPAAITPEQSVDSGPVIVQIEAPYQAWSAVGTGHVGALATAAAEESTGVVVAGQCHLLDNDKRRGWHELRVDTEGNVIEEVCMSIYNDMLVDADHRATSISVSSDGAHFLSGYISTSNAGQARDGAVVRREPSVSSPTWVWTWNDPNNGLDDEINGLAADTLSNQVVFIGTTQNTDGSSVGTLGILTADQGVPTFGPFPIVQQIGSSRAITMAHSRERSALMVFDVGPYTLPASSFEIHHALVGLVRFDPLEFAWTKTIGNAPDSKSYAVHAAAFGRLGEPVICGDQTDYARNPPVVSARVDRLDAISGEVVWTYTDDEATATAPSHCVAVSSGGVNDHVLILDEINTMAEDGITQIGQSRLRWLSLRTGELVRQVLLPGSAHHYSAALSTSASYFDVVEGNTTQQTISVTRLYQP